jgi:large subunit ribosomal protein L21
MYAIFESGGKQYKAIEGETIKIDRIDNKKSVTFGNVLMVSDGDNISYGSPYIASAKISADVVETAKGKKVLVFHQKLRKNHRKLRGHRQQYTSVKINKITLN